MARGRTSKIPEEVAEFAREQHYRRGKSHRQIEAALKARGTPLSLFSVQRLAPGPAGAHGGGKAVLARQAMEQAAEPSVDETAATGQAGALPALPGDDADIATLDRWIAQAQELADQAAAAGNTQVWANLWGKMQTALDRKRKLRPPPVERIEDSPDMQRAAERAAERLHLLVDEVLKAVNDAQRGAA
jgi:hypothetical protein